MSLLNIVSETSLFYSKLLDDLRNLELKHEDSSEEGNATELNEYRRGLCGCSINKTDDVKIATRDEDEEASRPPVCLKNEMTSKFCHDLVDENVTIELVEDIARLIAELAKTEECRDALVDQSMFFALSKNLKHPCVTDTARIQICRALGNLCYYNDKARFDYLNSCGLTGLVEMCRYCTDVDRTNCSDEQKKTKNTLITVTLGFLHNLTNENETLRQAVYELNVMQLLKEFIPYLKDTNILIHFASCLENLLDLEQGKEQFTNEKVALKLYEFMDAEFLTNLDDFTEDFFSTLSLINDQKMSKQLLCQTDFLDKVVEFMENHLNNSDDLLRNLGLLIVNLIVKEDKCDEIFEYKDNFILNKAIDWLVDFKNEQLYIVSAVIIANYLRSDENVSNLLADKRQPHVKIVSLLKSFDAEVEKSLQQINLIHSFLGALRNFCVAVSTRSELLKLNLIEVILPFINYENNEVKAKALSILRLLVKHCTDQNGLELVFTQEMIESFERIATEESSEQFTIIGESTRLVCYLPIAAKSEKNLATLRRAKIVEIICKQLKSEHPIMFNEALLALNVLVAFDYRGFHELLKSSLLNENLKEMFIKESMPIEMRINAIKLLKFLLDKRDFLTEEQLQEHLTILKTLKAQNDSNILLKTHLDHLIEQIENC